MTVSSVTVNEATGNATFTVTLGAAAEAQTTVSYATAGGSATSGTDFNASSGTLTFAAGATTATFTVPITNDTTYEGAETFTVTATGLTGVSATATGTGTIVDDGTGSGGSDNDRPTVSVGNLTVGEAAGNATFTVSLSNPSTQAVVVNLATVAGSATATACGRN